MKIIKSAKTFNQTLSFLNITLLFLNIYLGIMIIKVESKKTKLLTNFNSPKTTFNNNQQTKPDIYYIILDGYARQDILKEIYNYDNSWFIDSLKKMGFYVAEKARCNYMHTYLSLPSILNMRYLDELPSQFGKDPLTSLAARQLISENEVSQKLKSQGYTIINFASTWEETNENFKADITYKNEEYYEILGKNISLDETSITFLQTTLLSPLVKKVWSDIYRGRILSALQKLPNVPYLPGNKFILAHIVAPHPPYIFTAEGDPISNTQFAFSDEGPEQRPKYLGQLTFISKQIVPVLKKIIQNSSLPPIVILQSDHGPGSTFGKPAEWGKNYSETGVKERAGILYAIYFPDQDYRQFYNSITPVNTFRILFNKYFFENFEILPDKTFFTSFEKIYDFKDVTDILSK